MLSSKEKDQIIQALQALSVDVKNFEQDLYLKTKQSEQEKKDYLCRMLWCQYHTYISNVLVLLDNGKDFKKTEEVFELLELFEFNVSAQENPCVTVEKLSNYVDRCCAKFERTFN